MRHPIENQLGPDGIEPGGFGQGRQDRVSGVVPPVGVHAAVVAVPVACNPLAGVYDEAWVGGDEPPVRLVLSRAWRVDIDQSVADDEQDLQDVLANELDDKRHDP